VKLWEKDPELPCREEPIEEHHDVNQGVFETWLRSAEAFDSLPERADFPMAANLLSILSSDAPAGSVSNWFKFLEILAACRQKPILRVAQSVSTVDIAYVVYLEGLKRYAAKQQGCETPKHYAAELQERLDFIAFRQLEFEQWHSTTQAIVVELCAIRMQVVDNENVVHVASTEDAPADTDDADRMEIIDDLLSAVAIKNSKPSMKKKDTQRIDAPQVEDSFEKAVPEDTPGYIACAFPTLFPFGTGDYHASRGAAKGRFDFATWGKHVLQYHDQRFMRHNRFRYFFLNTWLRMKTPGVRSVFWKIHSDLVDLRLEHLQDTALRKKLCNK
jgi:hypothetical protein